MNFLAVLFFLTTCAALYLLSKQLDDAQERESHIEELRRAVARCAAPHTATANESRIYFVRCDVESGGHHVRPPLRNQTGPADPRV